MDDNIVPADQSQAFSTARPITERLNFAITGSGEWSAENLFIFPENVTHPNIYSFNLCFISLPAETIVAYRGGLDYKLLCTKLICASICIYKLISWAPGSPLVRTRGGRVLNQFYPAGFGLKTNFESI